MTASATKSRCNETVAEEAAMPRAFRNVRAERKREFALVKLAAVFWIFASVAAAQSYPVKPARIVVPYPPGGSNDVVGRVVAQRLSEMWGQPVLVENRPGGNAVIGATAVARSPGDGYTLMLTSDSTFVANPFLIKDLPYDPIRDFTPIKAMWETSPVVTVNAALPVASVPELISHAKAKPGALSYASFGIGSSAHLFMEDFKQMTGIDIVHIPYKGAPQAVLALTTGEVQVMMSNLGIVAPQAKAGKLRILASTTRKRLPQRLDLPTVPEAGGPKFETSSWFGLAGPANVPRDIVAKIYADTTRILESAEVRRQMDGAGWMLIDMSTEEFAQYIKNELGRWGSLIKAVGIKPE